MGCGSSTIREYTTRSNSYSKCSTEQIFQKSSTRADFLPKNITIRESRDSEDHPESTPIIFGLDFSGSMGFVAAEIAKNGLRDIVTSLMQNKPVSDPQIMFMGIVDAFYDQNAHPALQVTQFESDLRMYDQLVDLHNCSGGGGNCFESYDLPWLFAAQRTSIDSFEKRSKKGYLFTCGDEEFPTMIDHNILNQKYGFHLQDDITSKEAYEMASEKYNIFHIIIAEGSYCRSNGLVNVLTNWAAHIGNHALPVTDHTKIADVVNSVILINEGAAPVDVLKKLQDNHTKEVVAQAIGFDLHPQED